MFLESPCCHYGCCKVQCLVSVIDKHVGLTEVHNMPLIPEFLPVITTLCIASRSKNTKTLEMQLLESENYTVFQKTYDYVFDNKLNWNCPFTKIFGTLITKSRGPSTGVFIFPPHLVTYFVHLLYLMKLSRPISNN